jgi:polysaccharide export outer membrane protein
LALSYFLSAFAAATAPILTMKLILALPNKKNVSLKCKLARWIFLPMLLVLSGCSSFPAWLPSAGPSVTQVLEQDRVSSPIPVLELTDTVARRLLDVQRIGSFAATLTAKTPSGYVVGAGDVLEVSIWESPPATLFGAAVVDARAGLTGARQTILPGQTVNVDGTINVPFAGAVQVAGKPPQQIEAEIVRRLANKANQPQVLVRVLRNVTQNVTVVGEVVASTRMSLTAKGERLLDAVAAAGGVSQPVGKITIQLSRGARVLSMPLDSVIRDPKQNVRLHSGDVVTALFQNQSFTALGATVQNAEIEFEAKGISLAQALGRMAGLRDDQADARGLFIFRFEEAEAALAVAEAASGGVMMVTPEGKVPLLYRVNLRDPGAFLAMQNFVMRDKDVVYVATAPSAELQKFLNILSSSVFSARSLVGLTR